MSWLIVDEGDEDNEEADVDVESPIENHWEITKEGQLMDKRLVPEVGAVPTDVGAEIDEADVGAAQSLMNVAAGAETELPVLQHCFTRKRKQVNFVLEDPPLKRRRLYKVGELRSPSQEAEAGGPSQEASDQSLDARNPSLSPSNSSQEAKAGGPSASASNPSLEADIRVKIEPVWEGDCKDPVYGPAPLVELTYSESDVEGSGSVASVKADDSLSDTAGSAAKDDEILVPIDLKRIVYDNVDKGDPPDSPRGDYEHLVHNWLDSRMAIEEVQRFEAASNGGAVPEKDPPEGLMTAPLYKHQKEGLAWLVGREQSRPIGGILADDQVHVWFTLWFMCGSRCCTRHVWFALCCTLWFMCGSRCGSRVIPVRFMCGSRVVHVWFTCGSCVVNAALCLDSCAGHGQNSTDDQPDSH
jgi:hypothetical protein